MTKVVLDTNSLLMPFQFSLNLDEEIRRLVGNAEIYVPSSVIDELKALDEKPPLKLSENYREVQVERKGDDGVLEAARKLNAVVVTNDKELKKRALNQSLTVAFLRSGSHLELLGEDFLLTGKQDDREKETLKLNGEVVSGVDEAKYFLALEGYKKRFRENFGFEPFEGTLNVRLKDKSLKKYQELKEKKGISIDGFVEKGKRFGSVECFPSKINGVDSLLIIPEKTRYEKQAEIVAEEKLRDELGLKDGDEVSIVLTYSTT
ncbi:MAG: DUF120 domain-containing protein [Candidatus Thermoplasmatota archaeon]|nr:DUF120 domain-containing protein [Candidatus Thermoplasmatota archaeon]MBS3790047.1 DUF120 domain-containing protein [Candidatus Thermoplasmatota archaeon]